PKSDEHQDSGRTPDPDAQDSGRADSVHNASATIESLGGLTIHTARLLNSNEHFATTVAQVAGPSAHTYLQPEGNTGKYDISQFVWYPWSHAGLYRWKSDPSPNQTPVLGQTPIPQVGEKTCTGPEDASVCTPLPGSDLAAWQALHAAWETLTTARYTDLDNKIEAYNAAFETRDIKRWTQYEVTRTEYQTQVTSSALGKIVSGGQMTLRGDALINDKSQILAGGVLGGDLDHLDNISATGESRIHEVGTSQYSRERWRGGFKWYHQHQWDDKIAYTPADQITTIDLGINRVQGHTAVTSTGYRVDGRQSGQVNQQAQG
ncbi:MAG TPA: hypothetical protein ACQGQG_01525, partial [Xylella sp.]